MQQVGIGAGKWRGWPIRTQAETAAQGECRGPPYLRGVKLPPKHQAAERQLEQYDGLL